MRQPVEIFCCVAESDRHYLKQLTIQLAPQPRQDIKLWDKSQVQPGTTTEKEVQQHLASASIFVLLISPDFVADDYCYNRVMKAALERHTLGDALTIPVIVRPIHWKNVPLLSTIQPIPRNGQPISRQRDSDMAFLQVAREIDEAIRRLGELPVGPVPPPIIPPQQFVARKTGKRNNKSIILILVTIILILGGILAFYTKDTGKMVLPTNDSSKSVSTTETSTVPISTLTNYSASEPGPGCDAGGGIWTLQGVDPISCGTYVTPSSVRTWGYLYLQLPYNAAFLANNTITVSSSGLSTYNNSCIGLVEQGANGGGFSRVLQ